jgi:uracil-DNA glycosylase family 4
MVSSQLQLITLDGCDSCTLQREWPKLTHPKIPIIPPRFEHKTKVICIGEGPGATEDREGIPFVGESGRFLRNSMGIWQEKIYMTNIVRCRPPENRTPTDVEVECCSTYMFEDFTKIQPHALLLIGAPAVNAFWHGSETMPISKIRGIEFPVQLADDSWVWAFSTFHPSYVIRSERQYKENAVTPVFQNDLDYFFRNLDRYRTPPDIPAIPDEDEVCYPKTLLEVQNLFNRLIGDPGVDIETFMLKPYMRDARMLSAAFSDGETTFAFPVEWRNTGSWGLEAFLWCMQRVADLTWEWIAHNAGFELSWFWYYCKHFNWKFRDSAAKGRYVTKRSTLTSLANLSRIFLGVDIKTLSEVDVLRLEEFPMQKGLYYNAIDAWASKKLDSKIVMSPKQAENYDRAIKTTFSSTMMELLGIPVNLEESSRLQVELTKKDDHYNDIAQAIPAVQDYQDKNRKMFSLASPKDVGIVLHDYYGLKLEANKNGYCIDAEALEPNRGNALVDLRLDSQEVKKNLSTYVDSIATGAILGIDGWLHPSFTVLLTATNRLSSVNPNIQNWPKRKHKEIRRQVVPPKGYILVAFDYGGLEARGITIASNDRNLKKSFYNHEDIHAKWLNRFLQVYPDYKFRLAEKGNVSVDDYKAVWKSGRTIIKTDFVFASFYGAIVYSIANYTGLPQNIVEAVQSEFWLEYQGVQNWLVRQRQMYRETGSCETLTGLVRNEVMEGNEPINNPIQGLGAHIVLEAQNALCELSLEVDDIHLAPRWNVHDDLSFFLPDNNDTNLYIDVITQEMTKPRFPFINVPLLVEGSMGYNWCDMEEFGKWEGQYYNDFGKLAGRYTTV